MKAVSITELRAIQMKIASELAKFCQDHGLQYFLGYGTLLGAVRHNGYIPWDDDIDILMPRKDYAFFLDHFNKEQIEYRVDSCETNSEYSLPFAKISHKETYLIETSSDCCFEGLGVNIDVFPLDGLPESLWKRRWRMSIRKILLLSLLLKMLYVADKRAALKNLILRVSKIILTPISANLLARSVNHLSSKSSFEESDFVVSSSGPYGKKDILLRSWFEREVELEFEASMFHAPVGFAKVLSQCYGDYMRLPPVEKRVTHHAFDAYWR